MSFHVDLSGAVKLGGWWVR